MTKKALVIGGGVSGLTTALALAERDVPSVVVTEALAPNVTSIVAGALWEWPPAVCGYHHDAFSLERSKGWCMTSFREFEKIAEDRTSGAYIRPSYFYFRNRVEENAFHLEKMQEIARHVPGFVRGAHLIKEHGVNQDIGLVDAYGHLAPMVDTDVYMGWLLKRVRQAGIEVIIEKISGRLKDTEQALKQRFGASVIVNCAGLGSQELAGEPMYPLRGALVRLVNDGTRMPRLRQSHCVSHDNVTSENEIVFILPRGDDRIVLGALAEKDQWGKDIDLDNYQPVRDIYDRCTRFLPALKALPLDEAEPVRVGLRPFRQGNVRLEAVPGSGVIHNYAHGGAGVTFSWGCAREVASHVGLAMGKATPAFDRRFLDEMDALAMSES